MLALYIPKSNPTHSYVPTYHLSAPLPHFPSYFNWAAVLSLGTNSFIQHWHAPFLTTVCLLFLIGGVRIFVLINSVFGIGLGFILMLFPTSTFCSRNFKLLLVYKLIVANLPINLVSLSNGALVKHKFCNIDSRFYLVKDSFWCFWPFTDAWCGWVTRMCTRATVSTFIHCQCMPFLEMSKHIHSPAFIHRSVHYSCVRVERKPKRDAVFSMVPDKIAPEETLACLSLWISWIQVWSSWTDWKWQWDRGRVWRGRGCSRAFRAWNQWHS